MSRIGKKILPVKEGVSIEKTQSEGSWLVKGPHGEIVLNTEGRVSIEKQAEGWSVVPLVQVDKKFWGLYNRLFSNAIEGVSSWIQRELDLIGTGYKAILEKKALKLFIGFSHPHVIEPPEGIHFEVLQPTRIRVVGIQKDLVGRVAAEIRDLRPPEPYHGKGIRYVGEKVVLKAGKSGSKK